MRQGIKLPSALALALAMSCGDDDSPSTKTLTGSVLATDDDSPLAGVSVRVGSIDKATTTDTSGRFTIRGPVRGAMVKLDGEGVAPVSKPSWRSADTVLRMKRYDAVGSVSSALGGNVSTSGTRAAVRIRPGSLTGSDTAEIGLAAPDPRRASDMRAITGSFVARQEGSLGKLNVVSPLYVAPRDRTRIKLAPLAKVELDFPAWSPSADVSRLSLFAFDEDKNEWTRTGAVSAITEKDLDGDYFRSESDRFGWLAVGEFYDDLTCVKGCARDSAGTPVSAAEVIATGVSYFSQALSETDDKGCFELEARANAQLRVEVRMASGALHAAEASTGAAGGACTDLGTLAPATGAPTNTDTEGDGDAAIATDWDAAIPREHDTDLDPDRDAGTATGAPDDGNSEADDASTPISEADTGTGQVGNPASDKYLARLQGCGITNLERIEQELAPRPPLEEGKDSLARWERRVDCLVALPCTDFVTDYCGGATSAVTACDELPYGYTFVCADQSGQYADACDGHPDCGDGSDESNEVCMKNLHYKCQDQEIYLGYNKYCDGTRDCPSGDDEVGCATCDDGSPYGPFDRCDGYQQCDDGADEIGCPPVLEPECPIITATRVD